MKKLVFLSILALLIMLASCRDCPPCPKDMEVPECFEELIPYQAGDTLRFVNSMDDTMELVCLGRGYSTNVIADNSLENEGCCPAYKTKNLSTRFVNDSVDIRCAAESFGTYYLEINIEQDTLKNRFRYYGCEYKIENVVMIAEKKFNNILTLNEAASTEDKAYINFTNEYRSGLVGFKSNGVEWAKID